MNTMKSSVSASFLDKEIEIVLDTLSIQRNGTSSSSLVNRRKKKSLKDIYIDERKREEERLKTKQSSLSLPPVTPIVDQHDSCSIDSDGVGGISSSVSSKSKHRIWGSNTVFIPQPLIESSVILYVGCILFVLAYIWPPLIILAFIIIHKFLSHCFRENDFGIQRRQLFQQFITNAYDTLPISYKSLIDENGNNHPNSHVRIEHGYWKNARYVFFLPFYCMCHFVCSLYNFQMF
jgi:hypothetical protein